MAAKWVVHKRDGVWQAADSVGKIRFAHQSWRSVLDFALLGYYEETEAQKFVRIFTDRRGGWW